jgi:hypothetical protein
VGKGTFGVGTVASTEQFRINNGLNLNAQTWNNSRGTQIAAIDSIGKGTFEAGVFDDSLRVGGLGTPITKAAVDSNALEFTANSVDYRALQTAYANLYITDTDPDTIVTSAASDTGTVKDFSHGLSKNMSTTDSSITVLINGVYEVVYTSSFNAANPALVHAILYKGVVPMPEAMYERTIGSGAQTGSASFAAILRLVSGDVLRVRMFGDAAETFILPNASLKVIRID